jgi:hypothetical protein
LKESNMLKTMPALSLGFLLAGAAASNAGQPSRTRMHKLHAHRAAHYRTVGLRAREGASVIGSDLKTGVPLGATSLVAGTGNGRRKLPGRVLMGPEQIQRRFLPVGRTGVLSRQRCALPFDGYDGA